MQFFFLFRPFRGLYCLIHVASLIFSLNEADSILSFFQKKKKIIDGPLRVKKVKESYRRN